MTGDTTEDEAYVGVALAQSELLLLHTVSVVVGTVSLMSAAIAVALFLRMRRSFRHDLILLLILSDMLKTLWLVIVPVAELLQGTISSTSSLCQVSGYFLSVGIEACDLAVLLMAAHTGLYIFRGRTGLYPYRFPAYVGIALVSVMLASLAFVNKPAFVNLGPYCYLPSNPIWTTRALSWIPRYVIITAIMLTYTLIYTYVRWVMTESGRPRRFRSANRVSGMEEQRISTPLPLPPTPPIAYHGLISSTPPCDDEARPNRSRQTQSATTTPYDNQRDRRRVLPSATAFSLPNIVPNETFIISAHEQHQKSLNCQACICNSETRGTTPGPISHPKTVAVQPNLSRDASESAYPTITRLHHQSHNATSPPQSAPSLAIINATAVPKTRDKVRRQLGQLFVYPLVYLTGWLTPFIAHIMRGEKTSQSFWLVLVSLISLCIQGMVDSLVFLIMEKPWRYWSKDEISAWCCISWRNHSSMKGDGVKVGRTREEMRIDGTLARSRRERERAEWRIVSAGPGQVLREWWDVTLVDIDGSSDEETGPSLQ